MSELRDTIQEETGSPAQGQQDIVTDIISTDSAWEVTWGLICSTFCLGQCRHQLL